MTSTLPPKVLALDTASRTATVAVVDGAGLSCERTREVTLPGQGEAGPRVKHQPVRTRERLDAGPAPGEVAVVVAVHGGGAMHRHDIGDQF